jgi:hypothetical protein
MHQPNVVHLHRQFRFLQDLVLSMSVLDENNKYHMIDKNRSDPTVLLFNALPKYRALSTSILLS